MKEVKFAVKDKNGLYIKRTLLFPLHIILDRTIDLIDNTKLTLTENYNETIQTTQFRNNNEQPL